MWITVSQAKVDMKKAKCWRRESYPMVDIRRLPHGGREKVINSGYFLMVEKGKLPNDG